MTFGVLAREIAEAGTDRDRAALAAVLRDAATDDENDVLTMSPLKKIIVQNNLKRSANGPEQLETI